MTQSEFISNITYTELEVGQSASLGKHFTQDDINAFGKMSGDYNPIHFDQEYAKTTIFKNVIVHGMWSGSLISNVLGTMLPGIGTIYLNQTLKFSRPIYIGDDITTSVTVVEKKEKNRVVLECKCINQKGETVTSGLAEVIAPTDKITHRICDSKYN